MDWPLAIERNRKALQLIIAALFALGGFSQNTVTATLPRSIYRSILRILRPAESALRRLIIIMAHGIKITPRTSKPFPGLSGANGASERQPVFRLIDPLKRFSAATAPVEDSCIDDYGSTDVWDANEDTEDGATHDARARISVPGQFDTVFRALDTQASDGLINAKHMIRRLSALSRALENLPREACRLARWQARRPLALQHRKPVRLTPFRPGRPPGFRLRPIHEVDHILCECHALALDRLAAPDSS